MICFTLFPKLPILGSSRPELDFVKNPTENWFPDFFFPELCDDRTFPYLGFSDRSHPVNPLTTLPTNHNIYLNHFYKIQNQT